MSSNPQQSQPLGAPPYPRATMRLQFHSGFRFEDAEALVALILREHPYDLPVVTWEQAGTTPEAALWCEEATVSSD